MSAALTQELIQLNQRLLDSIVSGDWPTYCTLCDASLTCFEPEAVGHLVQGMDFHHFYFKLGGVQGVHCTTMCAPHVRIMGDVAVICYVRLNQRVGPSGPATVAVEETRVWQQIGGQWKHVHFHRARPS